jgi:hypothetical protein
MRRKRLKQREKIGVFEQWELDFMKSGPPPYEEQIKSKHPFAYLDGRHIWRRLQAEPDFKAENWPWAMRAFRNI